MVTDPAPQHDLPRHRMVEANGLAMHLAELGAGPLVLLCHGWPETWYSWRHQLPALAAAGYHAVAPDMRGYGRTGAPAAIEAYTQLHIVGDMIGLLDALGVERAVIVGHDWGAPVAWNAALMRPDRFRAVAGLSVPYAPRGKISLIDTFKRAGLDNIYMMYFQEPGVAEREFEADVAKALRRVLYSASGSRPEGTFWRTLVPPGGGLLDTAEEPAMPLPWLSEADLQAYVEDFQRSGFRGGLNWYRNLHRNWELLAAFADAPIRQPSLFVAGERDGVLQIPGLRSAVDHLERALPGLRRKALIPGAGHWVQQEQPAAVLELLFKFLAKL